MAQSKQIKHRISKPTVKSSGSTSGISAIFEHEPDHGHEWNGMEWRGEEESIIRLNKFTDTNGCIASMSR